MCLKNYSSLIDNCYNYLGYKKGVRDEKVTLLIEKSLKEIESLSQFKYIYQKYDYIIDELKKEPYLSFLEGANEYFIGAMTLGYNVERRIKMYSKSDMEYMVIFDACASAYLEYMSDMFEKTIYENPSYRFCPGYGGSKASDIFLIKDLIHPESIGIEVLKSNILLPQKSMIGIVKNNNGSKKSCNGCLLYDNCKYKKKGILCYK